MCVPGAQEGRKKVPDALELELWIVVGRHVDAGTKPGSSAAGVLAATPLSCRPHPLGIPGDAL